MKLSKRLVLFAAVIASQLLYFPINRAMRGGIDLRIGVDNLIPIWPVWAVPYLLGLPICTLFFLWAALKMENRLYYAVFIAGLTAILPSMAIFVLLPTYVVRPDITTTGWASDLLRWIYTNDQMNNAFPSGHIYMITLVYLFFSRWKPRQAWIWALLWVIISLSTLFTRQHYVLDLVGGAFIGWLGYRVGISISFKEPILNLSKNTTG